MKSEEIQSEIDELRQKIIQLELRKVEAREEEKAKIPEKQLRLAAFIHFFTCNFNHTDQCAWYYEKWDGECMPTKQDYLNKAVKLDSTIDALIKSGAYPEEFVDSILEIIFPHKFCDNDKVRFELEIGEEVVKYYGTTD